MKRHLFTLMIAALPAVGPGSATAQTKPAAAVHPAVAAPSTTGATTGATTGVHGETRLSAFTPTPGPLRLNGAATEQAIHIPLAAAARMGKAILELRYVNSVALRKTRSVLSVRLNEATLAQLRLDPEQPEGVAAILLPSDLWRPGYNKLTLAVAQHYADVCEDPDAPELWTEIDPWRSRLTYDLEPTNGRPVIADLDGWLSPGLGGVDRALLITPAGAESDRVRSIAAPLVAQALALRRDYAPLRIDHANAREAAAKETGAMERVRDDAAYLPDPKAPPPFHVLMGTAERLARLLPSSAPPTVDGPMLKVDTIGPERRPRLIVSGRTENEVVAAARNLAAVDPAMIRDGVVTFIGDAAAGDGGPPFRSPFIATDARHTFESLGFPAATESRGGAVVLRLPLAGDFYAHPSAGVEMALDFARSGPIGPGSTVGVSVNGKMVHSIALEPGAGGAVHDYRIKFPAGALTPGPNTVAFIPALRTAGGGECRTNPAAPFFHLYGSSSITLPSAGRVAELPDLARLSAAAYPFSPAAGQTGAVYVADPALWGGALTLIGKMAQTVGVPVDGWRIAPGTPPTIPDERAVVLAAAGDLPPALFGRRSDAVAAVWKWPFRNLAASRNADENTPANAGTLELKAKLGDYAAIIGLPNPDRRDGALAVLTADDAATLAARLPDLIRPEIWNGLRGDVALWRDPSTPPLTLQIGERRAVGRGDPVMLARLMVSDNPLSWTFGVLFALAAAVGGAAHLLGRRRSRLAEPPQ